MQDYIIINFPPSSCRPSLKHGSAFSTRRQMQSPQQADYTAPDELFAGQFVVFTVYALLELPAAVSLPPSYSTLFFCIVSSRFQSFNRFNKTYRSLKDKSSNFVQRLSTGASNNETTTTENGSPSKVNKSKKSLENPRDAMPPLTISESRRNIGRFALDTIYQILLYLFYGSQKY